MSDDCLRVAYAVRTLKPNSIIPACKTHGLYCPAMTPNVEGDMKEFVTKDSGERQQFESGMVRDTARSKVRYDLIWTPLLKRWAALMGRGAEKYGDNNWMKANSKEELARFRESAIRHFYQWFNDENPEEDHAAAILFNIAGAEFTKEKLK